MANDISSGNSYYIIVLLQYWFVNIVIMLTRALIQEGLTFLFIEFY
jgi:hypothetical protein